MKANKSQRGTFSNCQICALRKQASKLLAINVNEAQHYINQIDSLHFKNWHSLFRLVHMYGLVDLGFDSRQVQGIFFFSQSALTSSVYLGCLAGSEAAGASSCQLTEVNVRGDMALLSLCAFMSCAGTTLPLQLTFSLLLTLCFGENLQICKQDVNVYIRAVVLSFLQSVFLQQALLFSLSTNGTHFMEN